MNFEHVIDDKMRTILNDDEPTPEDVAYALEHCDACAMLDAENEDVPHHVYDARLAALDAAWRARKPVEAIPHLRKFWSI